MPDSNDIVYEGYQVDFIYVGKTIFGLFGVPEIHYSAIVSFLSLLWDIWGVIAFTLSGLMVIGIIYAFVRIGQLGELATAQQEAQDRLYREFYGAASSNTRWQDVEQHITTENPNDWKLAIIEADVMLGEILESAGYAGLTIGDKLKSATPTQFTTIDDAWQAHKVRNQIAHSTADFVLTKKLAQETVTRYRKVFQEFGAI